MINNLHSSHLRLQDSLRRAREEFYWPHMKWAVCRINVWMRSMQQLQDAEQQKEPLVCHESQTRPWESMTADLFVFHGKDYLVTTDRYSNFFEVNRLYSKSSSEDITKMMAYIAIYGIPNKLLSESGPNFSRREFKLFTDSYTSIILLVHQHTLNQMVKWKTVWKQLRRKHLMLRQTHT